MPEWAAFVGLTGFLLTALLGLARLSQGAVRSDGGVSSTVDGTSMATEPQDPTLPRFETQRAAAQRRQMQDTLAPSDLSTGALLANVAFTQGLFGVLLVAGAFYFEIPASAFGITADALSTGLPAIASASALASGSGWATNSPRRWPTASASPSTSRCGNCSPRTRPAAGSSCWAVSCRSSPSSRNSSSGRRLSAFP